MSAFTRRLSESAFRRSPLNRRGRGWVDARLPSPPPEHLAGISGQWRQGALAVRALAHVGAATQSSSGRSPRVRAAALAASLVADAVIASRAGTHRRDARLELAVNAADGAMWALLCRDDPLFLRTCVIAPLVPSALETGFRLGAGTEAVPVREPARPWRPAWDPPLPRVLSLPWADLLDESPRAWLTSRREGFARRWPQPDRTRMAELLGEIGRDVLVPLAAIVGVRRLRGQRTGMGPLGWSSFAAVGGYALARTRDDAHRSTTELWHQRSRSVVEDQRIRSRVQGALLHNIVGDDPKAMLRILTEQGSTRAADAWAEMNDVSRTTLAEHDDDGDLLFEAVERRPVEPHEDRLQWVSIDHLRAVRSFLEEVDEGNPDDGSLTVRVLDSPGADLRLRYRGQELALTAAVPELQIRLEPTVPILAVGTLWSVLSTSEHFGGLKAWMTVPSTLLHGAVIGRLLRRPVLDRHPDQETVALVTLSSLALNTAYALRQSRLTTPGGFALVPGTAATQGLGMLLASSWSRLGRIRWVVLLTGVAGWAFAFAKPGRRPAHTLSLELAYLLMPVLATATTTADTRREAQALDAKLASRLVEDVQITTRAEAVTAVAAHMRILRMIIEELALLDREGQVLDADAVAETRAKYEAEVRRLEAADPLAVINY